MRVHVTKHSSRFTVVTNAILQDRSLSFIARGVLAYLLSLPDGAKEDVKTLADNSPFVGRRGIENALRELIAAGYYVRKTHRNRWGRLITETAVYDTPQIRVPAADVPTGAEPTPGIAGTPLRGKNLAKETPTLRGRMARGENLTEVTALAAEGREGGEVCDETTPHISGDVIAEERQGDDDERSDDDQDPPSVGGDLLAEVLPLFGRLRQRDGRLTFGPAEMRKLRPLVADWRSRGASDAQIVEAVCAGLPGQIHAPAALVADRLRRKLPEVPVSAATVPARSSLVECPECGRPGRREGLCAYCRGAHAPSGPSAVERAAVAGAAMARRFLSGALPATA